WLNRMSPPPPRPATACSTKRALASGSVTSSWGRTSVSSRSVRRAPPATRTPSRARARAVEAPIPEEAPVTIAVFPSRAPTRRSLTRRLSRGAGLPPPGSREPLLERGLAPNGHAELHRARMVVVDLERRVRDAEALRDKALQPPAGAVAVGAWVHEHVRRQRREAA